MEIKAALRGQYHAGIAMLRQVIERCPEDLWTAGTHPRNFWRIAYHTAFYTHLYLQTNEAAFVPWIKHRDTITDLWEDSEPPILEPYTKEEMLEYIDEIDANVDNWVDFIDLDSTDPGFYWYKIPKLDHQILNIRHLGIHTGQLEELIFGRNVDLDWVTIR
jgi:hypothetical protein